MSHPDDYTAMPGLYNNEKALFDPFVNFNQAAGSSNMHQHSMRNDAFDFQHLPAPSLEQNAYQAVTTYTSDVEISNNMVWKETTNAKEPVNVVHVTNSELRVIQALRATNHSSVQDDPYFNSMSSQDPNPNTSWEQAGANGTIYNYDGSIYTGSNPSNIGTLHSDALTAGFEQPQLQEPAGESGALIDCAPACVPTSAGPSSPCQPRMDQATTTTTSVFASPIASPPIQTAKQSQQAGVSALQPWSVGRKCTWPKCVSAAVFKNKYSLDHHVKNVHTNPLICTVANCSRKAPFSRRSDLKRHEASVHSSNRIFSCSVPSCNAHVKDFTRKDHLTKHMRDRHDNYFCPLLHCPRGIRDSFANAENLAEHADTEHGDYECAVESCARAAFSRFSKESLEKHLRNHHGISDWSAYLMMFRIYGPNGPPTVTEASLSRVAFTDCKICRKIDDIMTEE